MSEIMVTTVVPDSGVPEGLGMRFERSVQRTRQIAAV
jgi:hypothetical protein